MIPISGRPAAWAISPDATRLAVIPRDSDRGVVHALPSGEVLFDFDPAAGASAAAGGFRGTDVVFWPDSNSIASIRGTAAITLTGPGGEAEGTLALDPPQPAQLLTTGTGQLIVKLADGLAVFDRQKQLQTHIGTSSGSNVGASDDGNLLIHYARTLAVVAVDTGAVVQRLMDVNVDVEVHHRESVQYLRLGGTALTDGLLALSNPLWTVTFPLRAKGPLPSGDDSASVALNPSHTRLCQASSGGDVLVVALPSLAGLAYLKTVGAPKIDWVDDDRVVVADRESLQVLDLASGTHHRTGVDFVVGQFRLVSPDRSTIVYQATRAGQWLLAVARIAK